VDEKECLVGVFSLSDIRQIMNEQAVGHLVVAGDLGTTDIASVTLETNLDQALRLLTRKNLDELPVVERTNPQKTSMTGISAAIRPPHGPVGTMRVIGMLSRRDLISAYHRRLHALQNAEALDKRASRLLVETDESTPVAPAESEAQAPASTTAGDAAQPDADMLDEPPANQ
jgi:hypothetical protein